MKIETNQFAAAFRKRNKSLPEDSSDDTVAAGPRALSSEPDTKYYSKQDTDASALEQASAHSPSGKFYIIATHHTVRLILTFDVFPISYIR